MLVFNEQSKRSSVQYNNNNSSKHSTKRESTMYKMNFLVFGGFVLIQLLTHHLGGATETTEATPNIITKADWNGTEATDEPDKLTLPAHRVIICHTASAECHDASACAQRILNIQNFHMKSLGFFDISYNFLIGGDGNVYEGRGWSYFPAVAKGYNNGSLAVSFIGTYSKPLPTENALSAAKALLQFGVDNGMITADYKLYGHRQLSATESPGDSLYTEIKQWPHWSRK